MKKEVFRGKHSISVGIIVLLMLLIGACSPGGWGTPPSTTPGKYLYVNNNGISGPNNYVSAFSINSDGSLTELSGSPYATGGSGVGNTYYSANIIALAPTKGLIFATNVGSSTITVFSMNKSDGTLTQVGEPVASGGTMTSGGSVVVGDNENYLFVGNDSTHNISVFSIGASGALTPISGSPFNIGTGTESHEIDGMNIQMSGNILYVADCSANNDIVVLSIATDGSLSPITGSPFAYSAGGFVTSFAFSSSTIGLVGATEGNIASYSIATNGALSFLYSLSTGSHNNQAVSTARNGSLAFVSGGEDSEISVVKVGTDGSLTNITGSPFSTTYDTGGYAVANPAGTFLYVAEPSMSGGAYIEGFNIGADGTLTSIGTTPVTNGFRAGLVIY